MSALFDSARFVMSVSELMGLPETELPEIAFAGRSNAGKSTTINVLCRQSRLAFSSKTPGRTQLLNFFELSLKGEIPRQRIPECFLLDFLSVRPDLKLHLLLNKADQLKTMEKRQVLNTVKDRALAMGNHVSVQLFSGLKKEGVEQLQNVLCTWLNLPLGS